MGNQEMGRLAFRVEGDFWVAYYAHSKTMELAIQLGSICMGCVHNNPAVKQAFMDLMRAAVSPIIEQATGKPPEWSGERPAPERERGVRP